MSTTKNQHAWKSVADLQKLSLEELQSEYERVVGKKTKSRNRKQLFATLAKKAQEGGGQSKDNSVLTTKFNRKPTRGARRPGGEMGKDKRDRKPAVKPLGQRDPRLPQVGSIITKTYKGRELNVKVTETGFEFGGKSFRSISAIAKEVTGSIWNGFLFFGLTKRPEAKV